MPRIKLALRIDKNYNFIKKNLNFNFSCFKNPLKDISLQNHFYSGDWFILR